MPKSDTWPVGTGLETMPGIDSAGSCDSVLSANSGFSDDSLEHLSAEEKACLMFLEETIDSLDTEDDSGLSNDETEQKPSPGNLAIKQAELSASMSRSTAYNEQKPVNNDADNCPIPSYLVPTPFVVANSSQSSAAVTKPSVTSKKNPCSKPMFNPSAKLQQNPEPPPAPLEVNVMISSTTKTLNHSGKADDSSLQRGPLSYDALVYLRKSASAKTTPLCPTVDHTIELVNHHATAFGPIQGNLSRFDRFHPEFSQSRTIPPAVPPKPKKISDHSPSKTQNPAAIGSSPSFSVKRSPNPEVVRKEALHKLGLLRDKEPANETLLQTSTPKVQNGLGPGPNRHIKPLSIMTPKRSPSFCVARFPAEPKNRSLHSSASFHHSSRREQPNAPQPVQTNRLKTQRSVPQNNYRDIPENQLLSTEPIQGPNTVQSPSQDPPNTVGYTVMVVPGMGADRREALRKLGLLKD